MKQALRKTTYEDAVAHAERLLEELTGRDEYIAAAERAASLDIAIKASVRHTYTEEYATAYEPNPAAEGHVPGGYAMMLWFDLVRDDHVLASADGALQCSYGALAIECMTLLFSQKLYFRDLAYILERNPICEMLQTFLDVVEETGVVPTPFTRDEMMPTEPHGEAGALHRGEVHDGAYVEVLRGVYTGEIGAQTSLYFTQESFLPYRLFLHGLTGQVEMFGGESMPLDDEICERFIDLLEEVQDVIHHTSCFSQLFGELCESPLSPPPRTERLLDALTVCRADAFVDDCAALADLLREQYNADEAVTFIW